MFACLPSFSIVLCPDSAAHQYFLTLTVRKCYREPKAESLLCSSRAETLIPKRATQLYTLEQLKKKITSFFRGNWQEREKREQWRAGQECSSETVFQQMILIHQSRTFLGKRLIWTNITISNEFENNLWNYQNFMLMLSQIGHLPPPSLNGVFRSKVWLISNNENF